jgi:hypothetical protein
MTTTSENNRLIAEFMGFPIESEITEYESGMDFKGGY